MSLKEVIIDAVATAKQQLGDLIIDVVLRRVQSQYDPSVSKTVTTELTSTIQMAILKFEFKEIDGSLVKSDDMKGLIFNVDQDIKITDKVSFQNIEYDVIKLTPTYAGDTLVLIEVQLRK